MNYRLLLGTTTITDVIIICRLYDVFGLGSVVCTAVEWKMLAYRTINNPFARRQLSSVMAVSTLAGSGVASFQDGIGTLAGMNPPTGIC